MKVPHETPHAKLRWLRVADVARRLGKSKKAALRLVKAHKDEMGAIAIPFDNRCGYQWKILVEGFEAWASARGLLAA